MHPSFPLPGPVQDFLNPNNKDPVIRRDSNSSLPRVTPSSYPSPPLLGHPVGRTSAPWRQIPTKYRVPSTVWTTCLIVYWRSLVDGTPVTKTARNIPKEHWEYRWDVSHVLTEVISLLFRFPVSPPQSVDSNRGPVTHCTPTLRTVRRRKYGRGGRHTPLGVPNSHLSPSSHTTHRRTDTDLLHHLNFTSNRNRRESEESICTCSDDRQWLTAEELGHDSTSKCTGTSAPNVSSVSTHPKVEVVQGRVTEMEKTSQRSRNFTSLIIADGISQKSI